MRLVRRDRHRNGAHAGRRAETEGMEMSETRKGDWMQTASGKQFWPLDPRPAEVDIEDIAHHLALTVRYNGACDRFYSVAEHSVYVSVVAQLEARRQGLDSRALAKRALLHDATEAYCGDVIRPIKRDLAGYDRIEYRIWKAVVKAFGLDYADRFDIIKEADNALLLAEQANIMRPAPAPWAPLDVSQAMIDDAAVFGPVMGMDWKRAKERFLLRYEAVK